MRRCILFGLAITAWAAVVSQVGVGARSADDERVDTPGFFDLPVPGGAGAYAALGLRPEERGLALPLLARALYRQGANAPPHPLGGALPADGASTAADAPADAAITIAAPLTAKVWRSVLELPERADLFTAMAANRSALLVAMGAMATDPSIRALLERDDGLMKWLVRMAPSGFALSARSLRIDRGRMVVPGGASTEPVWELLAGEKVTRPAEFIRMLTSRDAGRLAWFFDTLAALPPARLAVALPDGPAEMRLEKARSLYAAFRGADQNWRLEEHPFLRGSADPWTVVTELGLEDGHIAGPAWTWLWQALFDRTDLARHDAANLPRTATAPVPMAWLAQQLADASPKDRRAKYEMVRFAQRVFGHATADDGVNVAAALGGYRRYRALLLALERMEIASPATFARAVDAARRVDDRPGREERNGTIALQAALAIVERARVSRAIDAPVAERLVLALADRVDRDAPVAPAVADWIVRTLVPALPRLATPDAFTGVTAHESTILQAMAGPPPRGDAPVIEWETLEYTVDVAAGELARLQRIRARLASPGLDAAIASGHPDELATALLTLVYTPALGDPDGPALLSRDLPSRHDFGFDTASGVRREVLAWMPPREAVGDGGPWRGQGALLGLDLGFARLALRRMVSDEMPVAPSINLNDEFTLARTAAAINPHDLSDGDRDAIVAALARGRQRVQGAGRSLAAWTALAGEIHASALVKRMLPWMTARTPDALPALVSMRDLLWLGQPTVDRDRLDRWGLFAEPIDGRWRTLMPNPSPWEDFGGRADAGVMATQVPDLTFRLAEETARLHLPARLIPALLTYATQDYWHDVEARFPDDWPSMTRQAAALTGTRVEDYVAALAGDGPLRPR